MSSIIDLLIVQSRNRFRFSLVLTAKLNIENIVFCVYPSAVIGLFTFGFVKSEKSAFATKGTRGDLIEQKKYKFVNLYDFDFPARCFGNGS
jgi:hypothetical protein